MAEQVGLCYSQETVLLVLGLLFVAALIVITIISESHEDL